MRLIITLLLITVAPASWSADVYKCKGRSGETVYSESPCDGNSQPMKLRETRPSTDNVAALEPNDAPPAESAPAAVEADIAREAQREAQRACTATATAAIYGPSNDRVAGYQQQLAALRQQLDAGGSAVSADGGNGIRAQMTTLRQSITREHANAHSLVSAARQRCMQQHRREDPTAASASSNTFDAH